VQVKKLTRMKLTLGENISSLYKTAAAEISRKDRQITDANARCVPGLFLLPAR
jgi:hypothetical protein